MEAKLKDSTIYKPLMAGLFAGYFATIFNLFYDVAFRESTAFPLHDLINVSTIIFATLFLLALAGCVYAFFEAIGSRSSVLYIISSLIVTVLLIYGTLSVHRSLNPVINHEFQYLLIGIITITGTFSTFLVPYFVKKSSLFM